MLDAVYGAPSIKTPGHLVSAKLRINQCLPQEHPISHVLDPSGRAEGSRNHARSPVAGLSVFSSHHTSPCHILKPNGIADLLAKDGSHLFRHSPCYRHGGHPPGLGACNGAALVGESPMQQELRDLRSLS